MTKAIRPIRVEGNHAFVPLTMGYEAVIDAAAAYAAASADLHGEFGRTA